MALNGAKVTAYIKKAVTWVSNCFFYVVMALVGGLR